MASTIYEFAQLPDIGAQGAPGVSGVRPRRQRAPGEAPSVGVIYNPRSHGNQGADFDCGITPQVHIAQPGDRSQLPRALAEFAEKGIDLLVINGGDGTVRDVLTCGAAIFGDDWPAIAVLPKGKTNALTVDLGVPGDWTLQHAIDAFDEGGRVHRRPIAITQPGRGESSRVIGFILGAGAFTFATQSGQSAHRLGAFNSMAVAAATLWAILQAFLGSPGNRWRKGSRMAIRLGEAQTPLEHSGHGDPAWRQLLFVSTLERLPAGINAFGNLGKGLKLLVMDHLSRRTLISILSMLRGKTPARLRERGVHQVSTPFFTLGIEDQFIFDGEAFPPGEYRIGQGPELAFVTP
ncbi:diacylglycerol/lipid kinase family protein [Qipengyuania nanhaisediminis]|uniref:diacylglycerol/lipid kinase family protein n=1 Tax=Qipengyuania nanhaisediminis TaxID=604088 RepID=UPI0038B30177